jgi:hypothetical protein
MIMINDTKLSGFLAAALAKTVTYLAAVSLSLVLGLIPFAVIAVDDYVAVQAQSASPSTVVANNRQALLPCNNQ